MLSASGVPSTSLTAMAGAVIIAIALLVFPVIVIMSGALASAILSEALYRNGRASHEGSELLEIDD